MLRLFLLFIAKVALDIVRITVGAILVGVVSELVGGVFVGHAYGEGSAGFSLGRT